MKRIFKIRNCFCVILLIMLLFALNACTKDEQQNVTNKEEDKTEQNNTESPAEQDEIIVAEYMSFEDAVRTAVGEEQYYLLDDEIVFNNDNVGFTGSDITLDGGEERTTVTMSSNGGFVFAGTTYPNKLNASSSMTFKNIDFINSKGTDTSRHYCYLYAYAEDVVYENCSFNGGVVVYGNARFVNCTFTETKDFRYCIFIDNEFGRNAAQNVEIENCTFDGNNTAYGLVKVADDSEVGATLKVADCEFKNISNKAAVYVNGRTDVTTAGTNTYVNCTIGAILAKGDNCTINGTAMVAGTSYEE